MSHGLTATDSMFSVREMPWHGLGHVLEKYPTRKAAQKLAHPWEPVAEPLYRRVLGMEDGIPTERMVEVEGTVMNVRSDNGVELGAVGRGYTPITNSEMWDIAEALQGDGHDVKFETAGSIMGGRRVWIMVALNEPVTIKGDSSATQHYYLLQNGHDGGSSFKGSATATRVVCANTLRLADMDSKARGTEFTFRHSKNVAGRVEEARTALAGWRDSVEVWEQISTHLMKTKVTKKGVNDYLQRFIPEPPANMISERVRGNVERARQDWWACYNGYTGEGIQGTAYGLVTATSEYAEHFRRALDEESRFSRAILERNTITTRSIKWAEEAALVR